MKKIALLFFALVVAASCSQKYNAKVTFNVEGAADSTEIIVTKLSINRIYVVDTIYVKGEKTQFGANCQPGSPDFYYFLTDGNNNKMASVVLQEGDKLSVNVSKDGISTVEGSEEAVKYAEWERSQEEVLTKVYNLFNELDAAQQAKNDKKARELTTELTKLFVQHKQNSTKYLINNSKSISVIPVLYQKFSEALPVYGDINDVFIFKKVYDSLSVVYPNSPYVSSLADDIKQREQYIYFGTKIDNASEMSHPDISLYDVNAKVRNLSELDGKEIIISFWSTTEPTHKIFNAELKELYNKYKNRGLEVYQVCADTDKTAWASQVKAQGLEWVSVCDPGNVSGTLNLYNVTNIPTLYVIDKKGDIVEKDIFEPAKLEKVISRLVR